MISQIDPKLVATGVTFLIGMIEAARRFNDTGKIPLKQLPWAAKRELFRTLRKSYFTVDKPDHPSFTVNLTVDELRETLAKQGVVPEWPLSYRYGGEVYNGRYYYFAPDESLPHRQIHIRAFEHAEGLEIMAHEEPTPDHHPEEHLAEEDMHYDPAIEWVRDRLENPAHVGFPAE